MLPDLIVMKGLPCTGKTTLAKVLAKNLYFTLIELDDIRDFMAITFPTIPQERIDQLSYEDVCRIALTQLKNKRRIIIDGPLSSRAHFELARQLSDEADVGLLIVECKPEDKYQWQMWLQRRVESSSRSYKPSTWTNLLESLKSYDDNFDTGKASTVVIDTTTCLSIWEFEITDFIYAHCNKAYRKLNYKEKVNPNGYVIHHYVLTISNVPYNEKSCCQRCNKPIGDSSFYISNSSGFRLHKSCAESPENLERLPGDEISFYNPTSRQYDFPNRHACGYYAHSWFHEDCIRCVFLTQVRCGFFPAVVNHQCHQHPLLFQIRVLSGKTFKYQCDVCRGFGEDIFYTCVACEIFLHVNCTFLPRTRKLEDHILSLSAPLQHELEHEDDEYYCDVCETRKNPRQWCYLCEDCNEYYSHLDCALAAAAAAT